MLDEIVKLEAIRALQLPKGLLDDVADKVVAAWRARAAVQAPSHLRACTGGALECAGGVAGAAAAGD